jgi:hypothetical protein
MLPSEKSERWVRRIGFTLLALLFLYIIIWTVRFIAGHYGRAMEQRELPPEARARITQQA